MKIIKSHYTLILALLSWLSLGSSAAYAVPILSISSTNSTYNVGDTITVTANINGLGDFAPDSLGAYDIDFFFDSVIFQFSSITTTLLLGDEAFGEAFNTIDTSSVASGNLNVTQVSFLDPDPINCIFCIAPYLDDIQPSNFTLFSVDLLAINSGNGIFNISENVFGNGFGDPLNVQNATSLQITSLASVATIPEPTSIFLIMLGLILILGVIKLQPHRAYQLYP